MGHHTERNTREYLYLLRLSALPFSNNAISNIAFFLMLHQEHCLFQTMQSAWNTVLKKAISTEKKAIHMMRYRP